MNLKEAIEAYKKAIEKTYSIEECVAIMAPLGIHPKVIASIVDLICDQPERSKREDSDCLHQSCIHCDMKILPLEDTCMIGQKHLRCGALNTMETS